jgi:CRISPR-associated protein Cmr3
MRRHKMTNSFFLEPVDVLYLRGNKLFGGPGDHGEALMPPWPSIAAGALRTQILSAHGGITFEEYREGKMPAGKVGDVLGVPSNPGTFRLSFFSLARKEKDAVSALFPLPADLSTSAGSVSSNFIKASKLNDKILSSFPMGLMPALIQETPTKPERGLWLNSIGLERYLKGLVFEKEGFVAVSELWERDPRLGIALSAGTRTAEKGRIYTTDAVAMKKNVGFLASLQGDQGLLPKQGVLRFGGDSRAAVFSECRAMIPEPDWQQIEKTGRFKLVTATPGLFPKGWLLPGTDESSFEWRWEGLKARLVLMSLYPNEVVSGWDLATRRPKPSAKAVPVGSAYWFDRLEGPVDALKAITTNGLWDEETTRLFPQRRPEGFNNVLAACWPRD